MTVIERKTQIGSEELKPNRMKRELATLFPKHVKGHVTKTHVDRGVMTTLDKGGNDAADALASAAAAHHAGPQALTEAAARRQHAALANHTFVAEFA